MTRVAALYLPDWSLDRLRRAGAIAAPPPERGNGPLPHPATRGVSSMGGRVGEWAGAATRDSAGTQVERLAAAVAGERADACSCPRAGGWRPGSRWARAEVERAIDALPAHQRPPMRELGRRCEAAPHPFRTPPGAAPEPAPPTVEPPVVTRERVGSQLCVAAASAGARALGIRPGMPLAQARAQTPDLAVHDADPAGDAADLARLADLIARRWAPGVAIDGDAGLVIDITGVAHLHGGEGAMAARLVALLARTGTAARIAVAPTLGAAHALARHRADAVTLCDDAALPAMLAPLPVAALRVDARAVEVLRRLGIDTAGQLLAMPHAPLARRFGPDLVRRLHQATGALAEPIRPVAVIEPVVATARFVEPIATAEAIAHALGDLVPRLCATLARIGRGARRIELAADRVDARRQTLRIGLSRPSREPAHLARLLARRIEEVEPGYGIDALHLTVVRHDPLAPATIGGDLGDPEPDLAPLVDTLATRGCRTWRARPCASDVPERSVAAMPALADPAPRTAPVARDDVRRLDTRAPPRAWTPEWPRPARLLARPEPLDHVLAPMPDGAPRRFTWRGTGHRVVCSDGPERIVGEWWRSPGERAGVRDYFQLEVEGGARFWVYRRGDGVRAATGDHGWYMHGAFA